MLAAADRYLADCAHRELDIEDEATGAAGAAGLRRHAAGWATERHTMTGLIGPPPAARLTTSATWSSSTRALRTERDGEHADAAFMAAQEPVLARRACARSWPARPAT